MVDNVGPFVFVIILARGPSSRLNGSTNANKCTSCNVVNLQSQLHSTDVAITHFGRRGIRGVRYLTSEYIH